MTLGWLDGRGVKSYGSTWCPSISCVVLFCIVDHHDQQSPGLSAMMNTVEATSDLMIYLVDQNPKVCTPFIASVHVSWSYSQPYSLPLLLFHSWMFLRLHAASIIAKDFIITLLHRKQNIRPY